jgi:hypothetical protein
MPLIWLLTPNTTLVKTSKAICRLDKHLTTQKTDLARHFIFWSAPCHFFTFSCDAGQEVFFFNQQKSINFYTMQHPQVETFLK